MVSRVDVFGEKISRRSVLTDKSIPVRTFLHYSDPQARKELDVFGKSREGLFYNYDDRLYGEKWEQGLELAEKQAVKNSARYFEIALGHFHDSPANLEHVI